jgi:hypothetical protein
VLVGARDVPAQHALANYQRQHRRPEAFITPRNKRRGAVLGELGQERERIVDAELAVGRLVHRG